MAREHLTDAVEVKVRMSHSASPRAGPSRHREVRRASAFAEDEDDSGSDVDRRQGSSRDHDDHTAHRHRHHHHHHHHHHHKHRDHRDDRRRRDEQEITGFSSSGVELLHDDRDGKSKAPIVIPALPDKDFREAARRKRGLLGKDLRSELGSLNSMRRDGRGPVVPPSDSDLHKTGGASNGVSGLQDRINDGEQVKGLVVKERKEVDTSSEWHDTALRDSTPPAAEAEGRITPPAETADEAARRALLSGAGLNGSGERRNPNDNLTIAMVDEEKALRDDVDDRPDEPTLETYAAIPVEGFGAALLRGMGWKEGMGAGKKRDGPTQATQVNKRPELLGLGAKERKLPSSGEGGSSGAKGREPTAKRRDKAEMRYMPLVRRETESSSARTSGESSPNGSRAGSKARDRPSYRHDERDRRRGDEYDRDRRYDDYSSSRSSRRDEADSSSRRRDDRDRDRDYHRARSRSSSPPSRRRHGDEGERDYRGSGSSRSSRPAGDERRDDGRRRYD